MVTKRRYNGNKTDTEKDTEKDLKLTCWTLAGFSMLYWIHTGFFMLDVKQCCSFQLQYQYL